MTKPTINEVEQIVDTDLTDTQVQAFIDAANLLVDDVFDGELSAGLLTELQKWLAAHLLSSRDQRVAKEAINDVSVTYQGQYGLGLDSTSYGQKAKTLDTTGKLASLGKGESDINISSWT